MWMHTSCSICFIAQQCSYQSRQWSDVIQHHPWWTVLWFDFKQNCCQCSPSDWFELHVAWRPLLYILPDAMNERMALMSSSGWPVVIMFIPTQGCVGDTTAGLLFQFVVTCNYCNGYTYFWDGTDFLPTLLRDAALPTCPNVAETRTSRVSTFSLSNLPLCCLHPRIPKHM